MRRVKAWLPPFEKPASRFHCSDIIHFLRRVRLEIINMKPCGKLSVVRGSLLREKKIEMRWRHKGRASLSWVIQEGKLENIKHMIKKIMKNLALLEAYWLRKKELKTSEEKVQNIGLLVFFSTRLPPFIPIPLCHFHHHQAKEPDFITTGFAFVVCALYLWFWAPYGRMYAGDMGLAPRMVPKAAPTMTFAMRSVGLAYMHKCLH